MPRKMEDNIKTTTDVSASKSEDEMNAGANCFELAFNKILEKGVEDAGGFHISSMNDCLREARKLPPMVELYPNVVVEGDLCCIFGQSGVGKTIFAVQVACAIAEKKKRVLYVDFEMTIRQLGNRYEKANFPSTFFRAELDKDHLPDNVLDGIEKAAVENNVSVVFIDNITALGQSLDKGYDAGKLMENLNALKKKYNWTLVVINHVPKMHSGNYPLTLESMQGSGKLGQLSDDVIGLAKSSKDSSLVYMKQCKWRNGEIVNDADNVALYERTKDEKGNLCFIFKGYGVESELLATPMDNEKRALFQRVKELHKQGNTQKEIAEECRITQCKVSRILNGKK